MLDNVLYQSQWHSEAKTSHSGFASRLTYFVLASGTLPKQYLDDNVHALHNYVRWVDGSPGRPSQLSHEAWRDL